MTTPPPPDAAPLSEALRKVRRKVFHVSANGGWGNVKLAAFASSLLEPLDGLLTLASAQTGQGWRPIATVPDRERELLFWIRPKTDEEAYCDTSGNPITFKAGPARIHRGKHGTWSALYTATHWHELTDPAPPSEVSR